MKLQSSELKALIQEGVREKLEELTGKDPQKLEEFLDWLFKKQGVSDLEKKSGLRPDTGDLEVGNVGANELEKSKSNKAYLKAMKDAAEGAEKFQRVLTKLANTLEAAADRDPVAGVAFKKDLVQVNKYRKSVRDGAEKAGLSGPGSFAFVSEDEDLKGSDTKVKTLPRMAGTVDMGKGPQAFSSELDKTKKRKGGKISFQPGKEEEFESLLESMSKELRSLVK
jgi:hypothetical protein